MEDDCNVTCIEFEVLDLGTDLQQMVKDEESFGVRTCVKGGREALHVLPGGGWSRRGRKPCKGKSPRES